MDKGIFMKEPHSQALCQTLCPHIRNDILSISCASPSPGMDTFWGANRNLQITPSSKVQFDTDDLYQSATGGTRELNADPRFAGELKLLKIVILCFFHNTHFFFHFFLKKPFHSDCASRFPPLCVSRSLMKGNTGILFAFSCPFRTFEGVSHNFLSWSHDTLNTGGHTQCVLLPSYTSSLFSAKHSIYMSAMYTLCFKVALAVATG